MLLVCLVCFWFIVFFLMIRRPPRSTRTDTLFPFTTFFRSGLFSEGRAVRGGDKDLWLRAMRHTRLVYAPVITAEFNRDSLNKVSKSTNTLSLPCLVETARNMLDGASSSERRLLRRLINQEIAHYARY